MAYPSRVGGTDKIIIEFAASTAFLRKPLYHLGLKNHTHPVKIAFHSLPFNEFYAQ